MPPSRTESQLSTSGGARSFVVEGNRVVSRSRAQDSDGAFRLTLGELLAGLDDLSKIQPCHCGKFFHKIKRQEYCSPQCAQKAHPSRTRVRKSRKLKAQWEKEKGNLSQLLADIAAIERKLLLPRPRPERQVYEESANALPRAHAAFDKASPRKKGKGYEEGKAFLAHANEQIKRLGKRVKGY